MGHSGPAPTPGSKTAQLPPTLKAQHGDAATHTVLQRTLQPRTRVPSACSPQDPRDWCPRAFTGPSTSWFLLGVASREGLLSIGGGVSAQNLALQEQFLNFPGLSLCSENSQ